MAADNHPPNRVLVRAQRAARVNAFLAKAGLTVEQVGDAARDHLHDWARGAQEAEDFATAPWDGTILYLCKAVESELARCIGGLPGMNSFRESQMLGEVARRLDRLDPGAKERLCSAGVKVGSFRDLASLLRQLASIRNRAAHDDGQRMPRLTKRDAAEAQSFTIQILQRLHALRR